MRTVNDINDLANRRNHIEQGGGTSAIHKVHGRNQLTARERIAKLLDLNSFVEVGAFVTPRTTDFNMTPETAPADGVVTGYGSIEGRLVYVYAQDQTVLGGSMGEMHGKKILNIYDMAYKMGAPVIALLDSAGLRLQESLDALDAFGKIFLKQSKLSGIVPQITAIFGPCGGGASIIPSMSDFTFMTQQHAALYVNSANALDVKIDKEAIASADFHGETTGLVDVICENDEAVIEAMREMIPLLPQNNQAEELSEHSDDDPNRLSEELNDSDLTASVIMQAISDHQRFFELQKAYAPDVKIAISRMNGMTVGLIGNQNEDGVLSYNGCKKITQFVKKCDAFHIPIVTLTHVTGFEQTLDAEQRGLSKAVARMVYAFARATTTKINVIYGSAYGTAYAALNSKHIGADVVYAWPGAKIAVMNAESAVRIMFAQTIEEDHKDSTWISEQIESFEAKQSSPYTAASRGYVDNVIIPAATRKRVIAAIEMLYTKREAKPNKKHGTV